jgi:hypothetical protein
MVDNLPKWAVTLSDVGARGRSFTRNSLSAEDAKAFAVWLGVEAVEAFAIDVTITPYRGDGLAVRGRVTADVRQTCVVSLEPMTSHLDEEIEATFRPEETRARAPLVDDEDGLAIDASADVDDLLVDGRVDIAQIAAEFLTLAVDPYPRRPNAALALPDDGAAGSPFATLARLKKD